MPELQQNFGTMRRYMPAVLRQNCMGWYIEYYAYNQISQGLERKWCCKRACVVGRLKNARLPIAAVVVGGLVCDGEL